MGSDEPREAPGREVRGYRVTGRVQGVGFRWWTRDTAETLKLTGSVWNRRDGTVEVCAAGPAAALDMLERALTVGPPGARVDRVEAVGADHEPAHAGFNIEHRA